MLKQLSVIAIALLATQANAAVGKPFVDAGFGQSSVSDLCGEATFGNVAECEDKDGFFRVGAGVMITPSLSAEIGFMDFGKFSYVEVNPNAIEGFGLEAEIQAVTLQLGAYATVAQNVNVFGKLGVAYTQLKLDEAAIFGHTVFQSASDESEIEVIASVGAGYNFIPNMGVNIQFDYVPNVGSKDTGEEDVTAISAGLKYQF